jgi:hypothetical protein
VVSSESHRVEDGAACEVETTTLVVEEVEEDVTRQDPDEALLLLLEFGERNEH